MTDDSATRLSVHNARRVLKVAGWNLLFILAGVLLVGAAGEAYFRLRTTPSGDPAPPTTELGLPDTELGPPGFNTMFRPGVGVTHIPDVEASFSNGLDYWTFQRANSLGFLDREPIDMDRAADSCHISIIGDSFVEANQVQISDKMQVQLENIAENELPKLDVTTSAFGFSGTGQVNQISFYDGFARHLNPDLLILVFVKNDPFDNSTALDSFLYGSDPDSVPYVYAMRNSDGAIELRMPDLDAQELVLPPHSETRPSLTTRVFRRAVERSYFISWLQLKIASFRTVPYTDEGLKARLEVLRQHPEHAWIFDGLEAPFRDTLTTRLIVDSSSSVYREAWDKTRFGLEQFKRRADHDGVALMILAAYVVGDAGAPVFDVLNDVATSLGIPVVSQQNYIVRQGYGDSDAHFAHDPHWTATGHRWAAEAVWEYIKDEWNGECPSVTPNPDVEVDWIKAGHHIHTPDGKLWSVPFPRDFDIYRAAYDSVTAGNPTVRSDWNVHLYNDGVTYVEGQCNTEDVENGFFLHVIPADLQDLPEARRENGFQSITFNTVSHGAMFDGKCLASIDLPGYEIARIYTGQYSDDAQIWRVGYNFELPRVIDVVVKLQQSSHEPVIRSNFDVYFDDGRLIYVSESCKLKDRDTPFFLHVFPADENVLPDGREESGFDNLGFELMQKGGEHDGGCFAAVDLPEYEIYSVRTGQIADDLETWSAYYNFALPNITDAVQELLRSGREPVIRSNFDVYVDDDRLIYASESCKLKDRDTPFFLHVFPADENDLPVGREDAGFDNLGFELMQKGGVDDDRCFAAVDLPQYDVASVRTGQFTDDVEIWNAYYNFALPDILGTVQELLQSERKPAIRSNFDVYVNDDRLIYVKDSCGTDDRDHPFFLHVFPAGESALDERRQESGFDNLDFELMQRGGEHDGLCFAAVNLPDYDIASIRTGQWVRGEGNVWEANIEFGE